MFIESAPHNHSPFMGTGLFTEPGAVATGSWQVAEKGGALIKNPCDPRSHTKGRIKLIKPCAFRVASCDFVDRNHCSSLLEST
jgi:hypothetical protein